MVDFLDRLVARSRVPASPAHGPGRSSFAIEDAVVLAPRRPATSSPAGAPTVMTSGLPDLAATAAQAISLTNGAPTSLTEPTPPVVRVEVTAPEAVETDNAQPVAGPDAESVRGAPSVPPMPSMPFVLSMPGAPAPVRETSARVQPRLDPAQPLAGKERVAERLVEERAEATVESRTECVTAVQQMARPVAAPRPPLPVSPPPATDGVDPASPAVHIHIGRLDVRGVQEPAPAAPVTPATAAPAASILSLGDYLRGHVGARS